MWVKICGTTNLDDALLAADAGADAVGFVFAPSPRQVTAEQAAEIAPQVPGPVEKIGVFVDADLEEIVSTAKRCGLTGLQLHRANDPQSLRQLRECLGGRIRLIQVLHFGPEFAAELAALGGSGADVVLVDSRTAKAVGGTGVAFDWRTAQKDFHAAVPMIAAGGLTPANVAEAIRTLRPWGVDAVSGVEARPGKKDPARVRAFVHAARLADKSGGRGGALSM
jgi:phosphoribosylanthranilate isomerase